MKRHLKRYGWAYGLIVVLIVLRMNVAQLAQVPPLDEKTFRTYIIRMDQAAVEKYGKPAPLESQQRLSLSRKEAISSLNNDPRINRLMTFVDYTPALEPEFEMLETTYADWLNELESIFNQGSIYQLLSDGMELSYAYEPDLHGRNVRTYIGQDTPNYLLIQNYVKLRVALARKAAYEQRWADALREINLAAKAGDSVRGDYMIGHLIAVAVRAIVYGGFHAFAAEDVPAEVKQQAIELLRELRGRDPVFDEMVIQSEKHFWLLQSFANFYSPYPAVRQQESQMALYQAAQNLASHESQISDAGLKRHARRLLSTRSMEYEQVVRTQVSAGLRWSSAAANYKFIREVIKEEPEIFESMTSMMGEWDESLDPVTMMVALAPNPYFAADTQDPATRSAVSAWRGYLMEAALAAQVVHLQTGEWPVDAESLPLGPPPYTSDEIAVLSWADVNRFGDPANPMFEFGPIHAFRQSRPEIGWLEVPNQREETLKAGKLPLQNTQARYAYSNTTLMNLIKRADGALVPLAGPNNMDLRFTDPGIINMPVYDQLRGADLIDQPILMFALKEKLDHDPLIAEFTPYWGLSDKVGGIYYDDISTTHARALTRIGDRLQSGSMQPDQRPADLLPIENDPSNRPQAVAREVLVDVQWKLPRRVLAVWNGGPDGDDDRATVLYDPTNGTTSDGDLFQIIDYEF